MSHDTPLVIAHRTTMGHAPENTLLGIRQALEMGCDGVEIDVQLSADGIPVLIHDDELDRTTKEAVCAVLSGQQGRKAARRDA